MFKKIFYLLCLLTFFPCFNQGCNYSENNLSSETGHDYLIKINNTIITITDFNMAFEANNILNADIIPQNKQDLCRDKIFFLNQYVEELILLERAKETGISIPDSDMKNSISKIKKEYPERIFDQLFIDQAIPLTLWKKRFKISLLLQKVIKKDLEDNITIAKGEISAFLAQQDDAAKPVNQQKIIKYLRKEKAQKAYPEWIKKLSIRYNVNIHENGLHEIMRSL